jgi:hypothetical protein
MPGPKDQERATTAGEDLIPNYPGGVLIARRGNLLPRRPIANRSPFNRRIGEDDAKILAGRTASIDIPHGIEESLVHGRVPDEDVHGVPPHLGEALLIHRLASDVSVHPILISRVSKFDHDVAAVRKEPSVPDDRHEEIVELLTAMDLANGDERICIERTDDRRDSILSMRLRPPSALPSAC